MGKVIGGARALFYLNGVQVGYATGVAAAENINQVPVVALGDAYIKEFELVGVSVSVQCDFVRLKRDVVNNSGGSLQQQGVWPRGDTFELLTFNDSPMIMQIIDQVSTQVVYTVEGVVAAARSWRIDKGSILMENCSFLGTRMRDESDSLTQ